MSENTIKFEIVTPERTVLKEDVIQVTVPTLEGEITVLPGHIPLVSVLNAGVIEVKRPDGTPEIMAVSGGFIEVLRNKVVILADTAERAEEIDADRADEARRRAEEAKKSAEKFEHVEFANIAAQIAKELARSKAADKWKRLRSN